MDSQAWNAMQWSTSHLLGSRLPSPHDKLERGQGYFYPPPMEDSDTQIWDRSSPKVNRLCSA